MKFWNWKIMLGISLLVLSVVFYLLHYMIFRDAHHIFIYLVGDVAFVFVEVLLVTLVIHGVLEQREKRGRLEKINMVIGAFYSEVGTKLLEMLSMKDPAVEGWQQDLAGAGASPEKAYLTITARLEAHDYTLDIAKSEWRSLKEFLEGRREFMLRLLENPNLLEHESFTDLLWAVFHLTDELGFRKNPDDLPDPDCRHLQGDANRVYGRLARHWLQYMKHLKRSYPYLFSLAIRTNPFNR
ncbi:MAG: hypothetical protein MUF59_08855, partial [Candidatus Krumholzibacteria bacterium]|nr:hypothetical protein [Candidatus Krumholzibacteria bacterium]